MTMATPIAHKGCVAGAKAIALTLIDMLTDPALLDSAKAYFTNVQTKDIHYQSFITEKDPPSIFLNKAIMETYRDKMRAFYYNPAKYKTYLEQLGIHYPTLRTATSVVAPDKSDEVEGINQ